MVEQTASIESVECYASAEDRMIHSDSFSQINVAKMELIPELEELFPLACYSYSLLNRQEPWHWHNAFEVNVMVSGSCKCLLGGKQYIIEKGMGIFINSTMLHSVVPGDKDLGQINSIVFSKDLITPSSNSVIAQRYIRPLLDERGFYGMVLRPEIPWQRDILNIVRRIFKLCQSEQYGYEINSAMLCGQILAAVAPHIAEYKTDLTEGLQDKALFVKPMLLYIWEHYDQPVTLDEIAHAGCTSKNECIHYFHSVVGTSPIQYVKNYRLQRAAELLRNTDRNISCIAAACGFRDGGYFSRSFYEAYGMTPLNWRRAHSIAGK